MQQLAPAPPQGMQNQDMNADNDLRAQLAAVITNQNLPQASSHGYNDPSSSRLSSPQEPNIDPAIGGAHSGMMGSTGADSGGDDSHDGRKGGKRELSQSKRAAQNRAAQRAFRQRKEGYIKKLEEQVRDLHALEDNFKAIQGENYSLREYIIHLQSRLIESQGEYPQPPANINLNHPHERQQHTTHLAPRRDGAPVAPMASMSQLQASQARNLAAAGLQSGKGDYDHGKRYKEAPPADASDEEIIRSQLQASNDGLPSM